MRKVMGAVMGALLIGGLAAGCSNAMTKEDFKKELQSQAAGLPTEYTDCIVDNLDKQGFAFRKYGELSADENAKITKATEECVSTVIGTPTTTAG